MNSIHENNEKFIPIIKNSSILLIIELIQMIFQINSNDYSNRFNWIQLIQMMIQIDSIGFKWWFK